MLNFTKTKLVNWQSHRLVRNNSCQTIGNDLQFSIFNISQLLQPPISVSDRALWTKFSGFSQLALTDMSTFLLFIWFLYQKFY